MVETHCHRAREMDSNVDTELLITAVQNRPAVWDTASEFYHDRLKKRAAWEMICEELFEGFRERPENERIELESCNSSEERRVVLRCLREYRISKTERGGNTDAIQKNTKCRNIKTYQCSMCKYTCLTKSCLEDHLKCHEKEKPVSSAREYKAENSSQFSTHSKICVADKKFSCDVCEYKTNQKYRYTRHYRRHTGERPFECAICNHRSMDKCSLKSHIERVHFSRQKEKRHYFCDQCDSTFFYLSDLKDHVRCIHEGEEDLYSCTMCDFKCNRLRRFSSHNSIHTKNFSCDKCSFKSSTPSKLNEHRRIHSGEKPYKCNMCQYRATRFEHLKLHMANRHTGTNEKAFTCDICGYKSNDSSNLKKHIKIHTGKKTFKCDLCGFQSAQSSSLKRHKRSRHKTL